MTKPGEIQKSIDLTDKLKSSVENYCFSKEKISFEIVPLRGLGLDASKVKAEYTDDELKQILEFNNINQ
jgi:hypothetical protein